MRETEKLFNKNTEEGIKVEIALRKRREEKIRHAKCPYFRNGPNRVCARMAEKDLDANLSHFDIQHFCNGSPINCFFFRQSPPDKEDEPKRLLRKHHFFNIRMTSRKVQE